MHTDTRQAVLALGANLGDAAGTLERAVDALARLPHTAVLRASGVYRSAAQEVSEPQPDYCNRCVLLETALSPHALLGACLGIEAAIGRERPYPHAPRVLDIDLICMRGVPPVADAELTLPHPRAHARDFVMIPLRELEAAWAEELLAYS